ncbi:MAG: pirin family protein [Actinobacteria bacterium]|nr:pirin family protein [Actinomycetota bacterium]
MTTTVHRAPDRFHTRIDWLDSWHSFSFGHHYDAANTHHGLLLVSNDDVVAPGSGFGTHPHRDMEIITWVLEGTLEHRDSEGNHGVLEPGLAQRMSAGTGIRHSEMNPSPTTPVRLVQMWVLPDTEGIPPGYEQRWVGDALAGGGLVPIASGRGHDGAITIHQRDAVCWVGRLAPETTVTVPDAAHVHLYVARGGADLDGAGALDEGDAARLTGAGAVTLTAGPDGAEVIVWETA